MGPNTATQITNEMLMEQLMEMKSMIMNLQSEMPKLKKPARTGRSPFNQTIHHSTTLPQKSKFHCHHNPNWKKRCS